MNIWIATDLHLYNEDPDERHPFRTRRNLGMLSDNFAADISQEDLFIFLGDLCDPAAADKDHVTAIVQSIPCYKIMCRGNHDVEEDLWYREVGFDEITDIARMHNIIFSHKPVCVSPDEINIHGHLHTQQMSNLGPNHINAYAVNWNKEDHPVLLEDLIDSATVQKIEISKAEASHITSKFEKYTSIPGGDHYKDFLDISDLVVVDTMTEATASDPTLNQILQFCDWMDQTFQYGLVINGRWDPKRNTTSDDWDKYLVMHSPQEFEKLGVGVCWDYVSYEAYAFKKRFPGVKFKTYYVQFFNDADCPSHTFLTFVLGNKHFLFENSFRMYAGVYEASSEEDIVNHVLQLMSDHPDPSIPKGELLKSWGYDVWEYNALDKNLYGLGCIPYMDYIKAHGKCWNHTHNPRYRKPVKVTPIMSESASDIPDESGDLLDEVLFPHIDDVQYWMTDDDKLARKTEKAVDVQTSVTAIDESTAMPTTLGLVHLVRGSHTAHDQTMTLKPTVPFNYMTQHGFEDGKTPRVCFSTSIDKALRALSHNLAGEEFKVYVPADMSSNAYRVITPTEKQVPDVAITDERWVCQPIDVKYVGSIRVSGPAEGDGYDYTFGKNQKATLYDWVWEWIETTNLVSETASKPDTWPSITAHEEPSINGNDTISIKAVDMRFYNDDHKYVGQASVSAIDTQTPYLYNVEVDKRYRGKHYGNAIMQYVMDHYHPTILAVEKPNKVAQKLYKNFGFYKYDEFEDYRVTMVTMITKDHVWLDESATVDHTVSKEEKTQLTKKYGITDVGNTHVYSDDREDEKELAEMRRRDTLKKKEKERKKKEKERQRKLKQARNAKKRKAFVNKVKSVLPGVKQEDASAVDNPDIDWNDEQENFFDGKHHEKKFIQESYQFRLADHIQFFDRVNEAAQKKQKYQPVYVVIMHTGTALSTAIKTAIGSEYSHASISFDSSLTNMYSFARKLSDDGTASHDGGFRTEDIRNPFFQGKDIKFAMYMVPCTEEQIKLMKKRLDYFKKNQSKFTYDFTGLIKSYFHISDNPEYKWFCTRFVADILNAGRPTDPYMQDPFLVRPDDFMETNFAMYVTSGYLNKYSQKDVDVTTKRLLNQKSIHKFVQDHQNEAALDLPRDNPYERHILNYQLSKMDEGALDDFIVYLKSFKVRFDANGDILITRREYDQLDSHFKASVKMIKACISAGNVEGVKEELYKIHYMIELINNYYLKPYAKNYRPNTKEVRKDMMDLRAVMMSAFLQNLKWVTLQEPDYNFNRGYRVSVYGSDVKIPQKVLTQVGTTIVTLLK